MRGQIVKHNRGKPLKSGEKTIVLNVLNKLKRIYKFMFEQIRFPYTSKRTRHRSIVMVLGTCMCHKHLALMAEGHNAIPVYVNQSEINKSTWIC